MEVLLSSIFILLGLFIVLAGPIALINLLSVSKRTADLEKEVRRLRYQFDGTILPFNENFEQPPSPQPTSEKHDVSDPQPEPSPTSESPQRPQSIEPKRTQTIQNIRGQLITAPNPTLETPVIESFEQTIGTRWALVAGVVSVIFGVAFFLKHAFDQGMIGEVAQVCIIAAFGFTALLVGEITRRRGFDITAKGVTALGFAVLYAAVFSANRIFEIIPAMPAFALAILITTAAMVYAVTLNEVLIAFLSLLGGYLTPILLSTGQNVPNQLFTYVTILSIGTMICAYFRRWKVVNWTAFIGTYLLYTAWFETFYRGTMNTGLAPQQMTIALSWLAVFFAIFQITPIVYSMSHKITARKEHICLICANGMVTFYYLWSTLYDGWKDWLALATLGLSLAYFMMMILSWQRCREDVNLCLTQMVMGIGFLTLSIALYFELRPAILAWSVESVILIFIGLRYKNLLTKICGFIVLMISIAELLYHLPLHTGRFELIFNAEFGTWLFVTAAVLITHLLYRRNTSKNNLLSVWITEILYLGGILLLLGGVSMEWFLHVQENMTGPNALLNSILIKGMYLITTAGVITLIAKPLVPKGRLCHMAVLYLSIIVSGAMIIQMEKLYYTNFIPFFNSGFVVSLIFYAALLFGARQLFLTESESKKSCQFAAGWGFIAVVAIWLLSSEQIYLFWKNQNSYAGPITNWKLLSNMYISILWAVYGIGLIVIGFIRQLRPLRYLAIGLFALLLSKIFLIDTSMLEVEYRIAAFIVTGLSLVGISYLYQHLKKNGFFERGFDETNPG